MLPPASTKRSIACPPTPQAQVVPKRKPACTPIIIRSASVSQIDECEQAAWRRRRRPYWCCAPRTIGRCLSPGDPPLRPTYTHQPKPGDRCRPSHIATPLCVLPRSLVMPRARALTRASRSVAAVDDIRMQPPFAHALRRRVRTMPEARACSVRGPRRPLPSPTARRRLRERPLTRRTTPIPASLPYPGTTCRRTAAQCCSLLGSRPG